jgi:hypothetical protein
MELTAARFRRWSMRAVVEELLARDLIVLDSIDTDLFKRDPLAGGFGRDVQGKKDDELVRVRAIEKRPGHSLPVEGFVGDPVLHNSTNLLPTVLTLMMDSNSLCRGAHGGYDNPYAHPHVLIFAQQSGFAPRNAQVTLRDGGLGNFRTPQARFGVKS